MVYVCLAHLVILQLQRREIKYYKSCHFTHLEYFWAVVRNYEECGIYQNSLSESPPPRASSGLSKDQTERQKISSIVQCFIDPCHLCNFFERVNEILSLFKLWYKLFALPIEELMCHCQIFNRMIRDQYCYCTMNILLSRRFGFTSWGFCGIAPGAIWLKKGGKVWIVIVSITKDGLFLLTS